VENLLSSTGLSPRVAGPLAYLGWWVTGVIFWLAERRDGVVRFHAAQSIAAFGVIALLVTAFCGFAAASLSFLPAAFSMFLWAAALTWGVGMLIWLIAMWQAANGHTWRIPIAAQVADRMTGQYGSMAGNEESGTGHASGPDA
jgi:uncharacterized membrane protein